MNGDEMVRGIREALRASPGNVALRQVLAEALVGFGKLTEAEEELKQAIPLAPGNAALKLLLARVYMQQGATSRGLVVLEELIKIAPTPATRVLYARALLASGERDRAAHHYRTAVDEDAAVADPALGEELGVAAGPERRVRLDAIGGTEAAEEEDEGEIAFEKPNVGFADVGGMEAVKEEIRLKIIYPMQRPELYKAYGKAIGGGILLYGQPGCGKTHLARATAGEVKARFLAVGIADVLNMYLGESERNLHELFEQARSHRPCVLFFDEADALAASRSDLRQSAGRQLVNQFLSELDGIGGGNEGVLVLAATNAPWHLDPAFRRPGRFDRIVFVPPPDAVARVEILRLLMAGKPTDVIDFEMVAKRTEQFSGADLKAVVDVAIEGKLRDAVKSTGGMPEPLRTKDLLEAAKKLNPTTKDWFASARNHALYANQSGLYDPVLEHLGLKK